MDADDLPEARGGATARSGEALGRGTWRAVERGEGRAVGGVWPAESVSGACAVAPGESAAAAAAAGAGGGLDAASADREARAAAADAAGEYVSRDELAKHEEDAGDLIVRGSAVL